MADGLACHPHIQLKDSTMAIAARDLPPAVRAEMTGRTEDQLLDQYVAILAGVLNKHYSSPPATFYIELVSEELV